MRTLRVSRRDDLTNEWYIDNNYQTEETDEQILNHAHIRAIIEDLSNIEEGEIIAETKKPVAKKKK